MKTCRCIAILAPVFLTFLALISGIPATLAYGMEMWAVARDNVILRDAPSLQSLTLWKYDRGLPLQVTGVQGNWRKVSDFEGDGGWLLVSDLDKTPHMVVSANKDSGGKIKVNIRKGPGEEYPLVGEAVYGAVFATLEQKHGWVQVQHIEPGVRVEGWIKRDQLWGF